MSTQYAFGQIINNRLVLSLDASDRNSYPGSGTLWNDLSGNNNSGSLTNSPTFDSGNGGSIVFNGTNQNVLLSTESNLDFERTNSFSLDLWIKLTSLPGSGYITPFSKLQGVAPFRGYELFIDNAAKSVNFYLINTFPTNTIQVNATYTLQTGIWTNVVVTYDGSSNASNVRFYINGSSVSTTIPYNTLSATILNDVVPKIGQRAGNTDFPYLGNISTTRIYNRALSATEVLQNYNAQKSRFGL
jgi:hypothetical protein